MNRASFAQHIVQVDGYPRADWESIAHLIEAAPQGAAHELWCDAARVWLDRTATHLGPAYKVVETPNFYLLTSASDRTVSLLGRFAEKALRTVLSTLDGLAETEAYGKWVIMLFDSQDAYYEYSAYFYPEGEHPLSAGVFLNAPYGHIAIPPCDVAETEATVAHELTHNCLRALPIPLWVNEGLAVTMEDELCGNRPLRMDADRLREHREFWNEQTIQEFWSGESFARVDEGNDLSYELARYCIRSLAHDFDDFVAFARSASHEDGGETAAIEVYGGSLGGLIEQFFGAGDWSPRVA